MSSETYRIELDAQSVSSQVSDILDELRILRAEPSFPQIMGKEMVDTLREREQAARARMDEAFSLVVVGDFKRGKSTLVNALLGKEVMPTAVTPETVTINRISYSDHGAVTAYLKNGRKLSVDRETLHRQALQDLIKTLPAPIRYMDIKDDAALLKEITIVDTPGIGDLLQAYDEQVAEYLIHADALIYVISARSPLSLSEQAFLQNYVMPQSFTRLMVIVNMADTLETVENIEKIKALTEERLGEVGPGISCHMISALDAYARQSGKKRPEPELADYLERAFDSFATSLQTDVVSQRELIKTMRAATLTKTILQDVRARIHLLESMLRSDANQLRSARDLFQGQSEELLEKVERQKEQLGMDVDEMRREAEQWIAGYLERLRAEVANMGAPITVRQLERHFQFYAMDMIKLGVTTCVNRHQKDISDRIDTALGALAGEVCATAFGKSDAAITSSIVDTSWTTADTANLVLSSIPMGMGLMYLGKALTGFARQHSAGHTVKDFIDPLLQNWHAIRAEVQDSLGGIYHRIKDHAIEKLEESYQCQIQVSRDAVRQAEEVAENKELDMSDTIEYLHALTSRMEELSARLQL